MLGVCCRVKMEMGGAISASYVRGVRSNVRRL